MEDNRGKNTFVLKSGDSLTDSQMEEVMKLDYEARRNMPQIPEREVSASRYADSRTFSKSLIPILLVLLLAAIVTILIFR